jgi:hypothetical protein
LAAEYRISTNAALIIAIVLLVVLAIAAILGWLAVRQPPLQPISIPTASQA